jgi:hypothetical protein
VGLLMSSMRVLCSFPTTWKHGIMGNENSFAKFLIRIQSEQKAFRVFLSRS